MDGDDVILVSTRARVAVVTLNRPEVRNALNTALIASLRRAMGEAEASDDVDVVVLTGADPAFCAGLDLRELGSTASNLPTSRDTQPVAPWAQMSKPVIGAINGPAVTGGLEIALWCDFLIASERALFADTHARVGQLPGWGLSVLLPQAIGVRAAKDMSVTGRFVGAEEALRLGLVTRVVPHDALMDEAMAAAGAAASADQRTLRALLDEYRQVTSTTVAEGLQVEAKLAADWRAAGVDTAEVARRRDAIIEQGRRHVRGDGGTGE